MIRITVQVDGMMCGMCEAHVNDAVRKHLTVKKVTSNHKKKETVILTEQDIPDARLESVITESGYTFLGASREEDRPRGLDGSVQKVIPFPIRYLLRKEICHIRLPEIASPQTPLVGNSQRDK